MDLLNEVSRSEVPTDLDGPQRTSGQMGGLPQCPCSGSFPLPSYADSCTAVASVQKQLHFGGAI